MIKFAGKKHINQLYPICQVNKCPKTLKNKSWKGKKKVLEFKIYVTYLNFVKLRPD